MPPSPPHNTPFNMLTGLLVLLSLIFLAMLLSTAQPGVFFSGDGGLKYLILQQHRPGQAYTTLHLQTSPWVQQVWNQGYYPFAEPFVYNRQGQQWISFPPFFQQLSQPFFNIFGWKGLYIIPAASLLLLWTSFLWLMNRMNQPRRVVLVSFFILVFCSPLTLYGALFWEHTLAVLLLFSGVTFFIHHPRHKAACGLLGLLCGSSALFRPEALLLAGLLGALVLYEQLRARSAANLLFLAGLTTSLGGFLAFNLLTYHSLLGLHGYQLSLSHPAAQRVKDGFEYMTHMLARLAFSFPFFLLLIGLLVYNRIQQKPIPGKALRLVLISMLFALIMPFFAPNAGGVQWGPRYYLMLIPILIVAAVLLVSPAGKLTGFPQKWSWLLVPVMLVALLINSLLGYNTLRKENATRVKPCLTYLQNDSCRNLVVANQYIAQELAALFPTKNIFRLEAGQSPDALQVLLSKASVRDIIFIDWQRGVRSFCQPVYSPHDMIAAEMHIGQYYLVRCHW